MADFSFIPAYLTRILTLGYFLFIAPAVCFAQHPVNKHIDSLLAILPPAHDDTNKVNILCKLANLYPDYDPNKGLEIAKQSLQLSEKLHWDEGIIHSLISAGLNECSRTAYLSALKYFENARDKATEITNKSLVGVATEHCGIAYYDQNNYPEALRLFFDALQVSEELHNPKQQYMILEYIGKIYEAQRQYDKALDFYKRSYDKALKAGETKAKTKNLINIGQVYQEMGRYNEALTCFSESIVTFTAQHDEGGVAVSLANMGAINQQLHKYGVALQMEFDALHIYEKYADRMNIASVCANIGRIYLVALTDTTGAIIPDSLRNRKTNIRKGFYYLHKSEELCKNLSFLDGLYTTYADLSFAYELNGNFQAALDAYKGYSTIRDSIYSTENNVKISNVEISREVALKDRELKIKKLELAKNRNENIFFALGMVSLLIIIFTLYRNFSTQKKLNATITQLVYEQEKTIVARTEALTAANIKLVNLVQFNVHNIREPITRIMGLLMLKKEVSKEEFNDTCIPMLEQAVNDLDKKLQQVVKATEETTK